MWNMISNYNKSTNIIVHENKMLGEIFGPVKYEVSGKYNELGNKELNDMYNIIWALKSRSLWWMEHIG